MKTIVDTFVELSLKLQGFGKDEQSNHVIDSAIKANRWFTRPQIVYAVDSIRDNMLDKSELIKWLSDYNVPVCSPRNVAVIMAGNIPLVGFYDMLCVLASGHKCYIKTSSKDAILIDYCISLIKEIDPLIPIEKLTDRSLDAVIATGSDNTNRYFRNIYSGRPALLRGSRASVAVLDGNESDEDLHLLANDVFLYSGLGCRNISKIFMPLGFDLSRLINAFKRYENLNPKYVNNYKQRRAILIMQNVHFEDGGFFLMCESSDFPEAISEISISYYNSLEEPTQWLAQNDSHIQCVVSKNMMHSRVVGLGESQKPGLNDYPDGKDVIAFLAGL